MVRVGPEQYDAALDEPHVRPMDFTGRPLRGMVYVSPTGLRTRAAVEKWVRRGIAFVTMAKPSPRRAKRPRPARTRA
jgi:hypothetical protein